MRIVRWQSENMSNFLWFWPLRLQDIDEQAEQGLAESLDRGLFHIGLFGENLPPMQPS